MYILSEKALKRIVETNFTNHKTALECRCLPERDWQQGNEAGEGAKLTEFTPFLADGPNSM